MSRPTWAAVALVLALPAAGRADPPKRPTGALLDPGKHPRVALLEAKLLADPAATWVERARVDDVLAEQKLQALFGPQGVGDRARLGRLLKADVLVMVRPGTAVVADPPPGPPPKVGTNVGARGPAVPFLRDTFEARDDDRWKVVRGEWAWEDGRLVCKAPSKFATVTAARSHPRDFMGRVRYTTTGGDFKSVGVGFDMTAGGDHQSVYINAGTGSAVRAFHRVNGADTYPPAGVVPVPVALYEEVTLDFAVRGDLLNTWVNGRPAHVYRLPVPRREGVFGVWTHAATARFSEVTVAELPPHVKLAERPGEEGPSPLPDPGRGAALDVVVSESAGGLRLLVRSVPITADPAADVANLLAAVRDGLRRHGEAVREVVAVPPFASGDLGYDTEHLRAAYAKLAERVVIDRPGVVAVELAEAEALAAELKLTAPGAAVARPTPLYLLGAYRHAGAGADRTVTLTLRAARGGVPAGEPVVRTVKPAAAAAEITAWARAHRGAAGPAAPPPDPAAEARQLAALAADNQRAGNGAEALALMEASLLVNPAQPELHADAMDMLRVLIEGLVTAHSKRPDGVRTPYVTATGEKGVRVTWDSVRGPRVADVEAARRIAHLQRRGWDHMEVLIHSRAVLPRFHPPDKIGGPRRARWFHTSALGSAREPGGSGVEDEPDDRDLYDYRRAEPGLRPYDGWPAELGTIHRELARDRRAAAARSLPVVVETGDPYEIGVFLLAAFYGLPPAERWTGWGDVFLRFQDSPPFVAAARRLTNLNSLTYRSAFPQELVEFRRLLDRLQKDGNAEVRAMAAAAWKGIPGWERERRFILNARAKREKEVAEREAAQAAAPRPARVPTPVPPTYAEETAALDAVLAGSPLRRVALTTTPGAEWALERLHGCVSGGPGTDIYWANRPTGRGAVLLVMKEKGVLRPVWSREDGIVGHVQYDGRYVWATTQAGALTVLLVLDPVTERTYTVGPADGLPALAEGAGTGTVSFIPLDPGRVCAAGYFGRTWVGTVTFDPAAGKGTVRVVHTAREQPDYADEQQWTRTTVAFQPFVSMVLRGDPGADGKAGRRVLIQRSPQHPGAALAAHPLLFDPDAGTVEVMQDSYSAAGRVTNWGTRDPGGPVYFLAFRVEGPEARAVLRRLDFPGVVRELGPVPVPAGTRSMDVELTFSAGRVWLTRRLVGDARRRVTLGPVLWVGDADGRELPPPADADVPRRSFRTSAHYGQVTVLPAGSFQALCVVDGPTPPAGK